MALRFGRTMSRRDSAAHVISQHSSDQERGKRPILGDTQMPVGRSNAILELLHDASIGRLAARAKDRGDLAPTIEPAQPDLLADHEPEEQDECDVLGRQRAPGSSRAGGTPRSGARSHRYPADDSSESSASGSAVVVVRERVDHRHQAARVPGAGGSNRDVHRPSLRLGV